MALRRSQDALRPEVLPARKQLHAAPSHVGPDIKGRISSSEHARAMAKLPRRGSMLPRKISCDPRFKVHNERRKDWLRARRVELSRLTGEISHSVGAMLASAAWLYAGGEFAAELAAEKADLELFKTAAGLTATARQHDLASFEMAVREQQARGPQSVADPLARYMPQ